MKQTIPLFLVVLGVAIIGCNDSNDTLKIDQDELNGFAPSESLFEGKWTWLETNGVELGSGIHYRKDSVSEGYSWKLNFYETNGQGGKLQSYKGDVLEILYLYKYTSSNNPLQQKLTLDKMTNAAPEDLYWEIINKDEEVHLYLRNAAYFNDSCCDAKFEHHFLLTGVSTL